MQTDELILRPKKQKMILLAIVSMLFTYGGTLIIEDNSLKGWSITLFFALCLLIALIQLIPNSSQLKLTREGFIMTTLLRSHFTKWEDVKYFKEGRLGPKKMVMFDYTDKHDKFTAGKSIARHLSGSEGALPDTYGLKTHELISILNEWKINTVHKSVCHE
jgi:hypothetical protein